MLVIGLSVGLGASLLRQQMAGDREAVTRARAEVILQALGAYARVNNRLPCAAPPASAATGLERSAADCASAPRGLVPWATIGLQRRDVQDGHGRWFAYHVDPGYAQTASLAAFCSVTAGAAALKVYGVASPRDAGTRLLADHVLPFVLLSSGLNGFGAYVSPVDSTELSLLPAPLASAYPSEAINAAGAGAEAVPATAAYYEFVDRDRSASASDPFDDVLFYRGPQAFVAAYAGTVCP